MLDTSSISTTAPPYLNLATTAFVLEVSDKRLEFCRINYCDLIMMKQSNL